MSGSDQQWQKIDELQLTGKITSLSLMNNELTLVIGTDCGEMYLLSAESFKDCRSHSESHINGVTCVAFGESSDEFWLVHLGLFFFFANHFYSIIINIL